MTERASRAWCGVAVLLMVAGACTTREPPVAGAVLPAAASCRAGPDGKPQAGRRIVDRGIGGTGAPAALGTVADRGIGGTGIVGVVTGFGSVCVDEQEVALGGAVPVTVDEAGADPSVLRAGQLVALEASGHEGGLVARSVRIRHEVSGPVELAGPGSLRVAGQDVTVTDATWGAPPLAPGDWVAVSGLRTPEGTVVATRLDTRSPGPVLVHGTLVRDGTRLHIGGLAIAARPDAGRLVGRDVTATGVLLGAELQADRLDPDQLPSDPGGYFGAGVSVLLVEGFVSVDGGGLRIGRAVLPAATDLAGTEPRGRVVVRFNRAGNGSFEAVSVGTGRTPDGASMPAPGAGRHSSTEPGTGQNGGPGRGRPGQGGAGQGGAGQDPAAGGSRAFPGQYGPDNRSGGFDAFPGGPGGGAGGRAPPH